MAKDGFRVMDSDMHVFEPADLWQRYIDPAYVERAPVGLNRVRQLGNDLLCGCLRLIQNPVDVDR